MEQSQVTFYLLVIHKTDDMQVIRTCTRVESTHVSTDVFIGGVATYMCVELMSICAHRCGSLLFGCRLVVDVSPQNVLQML